MPDIPIYGNYSIQLTQDVIWGDMDAYGHVNNTVYFRYFECARIAFFDRIGVAEHKKQFNQGPILANANCNFRLPLEYPDRIHIAARPHILSPKKIKVEHIVFSENRNALAAEGESLLVFYDYNQGCSCEIPPQIITAIETLVG